MVLRLLRAFLSLDFGNLPLSRTQTSTTKTASGPSDKPKNLNRQLMLSL